MHCSDIFYYSDNTALQKKLKYTIDEYDHIPYFCGCWIRIWYSFLSITSRFVCIGSRNFCISIENWKKSLSTSVLSLYFGCSVKYFWTRNPNKISEWTYHDYLLIYRRSSFLSKIFNGSKPKLTKIWKPKHFESK